MEDTPFTQVIYPTHRLLGNPRVFWAIANSFDGPPGELIQDAFYDILEHHINELDDLEEADWGSSEFCFRMDDEREGVFQVIANSGQAVELHPQGDGTEGGSRYSTIKNMEQLSVSSHIYTHLVRSLEEARPDLAGDIALVEMPSEANGFLRDKTGDKFAGQFHLMSDPDKLFNFEIDILDLNAGELKASVQEAN